MGQPEDLGGPGGGEDCPEVWETQPGGGGEDPGGLWGLWGPGGLSGGRPGAALGDSGRFGSGGAAQAVGVSPTPLPPPPPGPRSAALSLLGCLGGGVLLGTALLDLLPTYLGSIGAALRELRIPVRDSGEGVGVWDGMGGRGGGMD